MENELSDEEICWFRVQSAIDASHYFKKLIKLVNKYGLDPESINLEYSDKDIKITPGNMVPGGLDGCVFEFPAKINDKDNSVSFMVTGQVWRNGKFRNIEIKNDQKG